MGEGILKKAKLNQPVSTRLPDKKAVRTIGIIIFQFLMVFYMCFCVAVC